ncbi:IS701 family transposase [Xanthomonas oryzae pv. oryzae]|nr:IS701 family transposase [Xanthomonas oryzae]URJ84047.1 IS701 family transposase [Xanthomonas oryzae pv. oryzae]
MLQIIVSLCHYWKTFRPRGRAVLNRSLEVRFEQYGEVVAAALSHADRKQPAHWYLKGLLLPGGRKSVEPMAARVHPQNVRSAHQSMHHLVADADWSDQALLAAVAAQVLPTLSRKSAACHWIVDDTGFSKKGVHSVGVARQYCGRLGKTDNCQVAVSLSIANEHGSLPVGYRLYLPEQWAQDTVRRKKAGVPDQVVFQTKTALAMDQIDSALATGIAAGVVLADAAYGTETHWRDQLSERGLLYMVGVRSNTKVYGGDRTNLRPCRQPALRAVGPAHDRCAIAHMRRSRYMKSRRACPQGRIGRSAGARAATQRSVRGSRRCGFVPHTIARHMTSSGC